MRRLVWIVLMSSVLVGSFGCSAEDIANTSIKPVAAMAVIPSRTLFKVTLIDGLNSDTSSAGDTFLARLAEPIVVNGRTVLEEGTIISGLVYDSADSRLMARNPSISVVLTGIMQGDRTVSITTDAFSASAVSSGKRNAKIIAGGAGPGDTWAGFAFAAKGNEIHYGSEIRLNFTLTNSVQMQPFVATSAEIPHVVSN